MASWSQSHFLQSLGWATLNSFWQMALLWCLFLAAATLFKLSSHKKYQLSVFAIITGFAWFVLSFVFFYKSSPVSTIAIFDRTVSESNSLLNIFLISASVAYLSLLIFPSYKLFKNWQFVQRIKKEGLQKADLNYRLFVQKISGHLGIGKKVSVYISEIVNSPVTVGYIKPIILLPIAALNNLSTQQVEAVLLHELSHIKRYDYLVNFIISIIHTVLYFNPFVKLFMKSIEVERENCCDQLVLQFGYDKVGYASALLTLEKFSSRGQVLAIAATGKNYLLNRIEKIVGMEKKKGFQVRQFAAVLAALFCIVAFNSVLIIKEKKKAGNYAFAYSNVGNPFALFSAEDEASSPVNSITPAPVTQTNQVAVIQKHKEKSVERVPIENQPAEPSLIVEQPGNNDFVQVAQDDVDASLTTEQKEQVSSTVKATKKVMTNLQWKEIEAQIADAMTKREKAIAKQEFKNEVDNLNWQNIEQNLKAQYENVDWNKINTNISSALTVITLDSIQTSYNLILSQLEKTEKEIAKAKAPSSCSPMPDASVDEIRKAKENVQIKLETLKALRSNKKVIKL
jgi:beta-lactamase regulating signal transducer with metallopeptidase domain